LITGSKKAVQESVAEGIVNPNNGVKIVVFAEVARRRPARRCSSRSPFNSFKQSSIEGVLQLTKVKKSFEKSHPPNLSKTTFNTFKKLEGEAKVILSKYLFNLEKLINQ